MEHAFGRSLERAVALSDDVLLVWAMNGQPLLPQHGFPLRLIVPGWYGMASVKWLTRIEALTKPFDGYQQVTGYHFRSSDEPPLVGSAEELAEIFRAYGREGMSHIQVWTDTASLAGLEALALVLEILDRG